MRSDPSVSLPSPRSLFAVAPAPGLRAGLRLGLVVAVCALAGCGASDREAGPGVVAIVGDVDITGQRLRQAIDRLHGDEEVTADLARDVLGRLIDIELLVQAAEERHLERDPKVRGQVEGRQRELLLEELFRRGVVEMTEGVSTQEARDYFEEHHIGEVRRVRRILVDSPQAATQVITRLRNGEDFAALAREVSDDPETSGKGGDLGMLSRLDFRNYALRREVFAADIGAWIGPVQEPDGYSVMTVESVDRMSFEKLESKVREAVSEQKRTLATFAYLEGLADDAGIEGDDAALAVLFTRLRDAGTGAPELGRGEAATPIFRKGQHVWTIGDFLEAVAARQDPVELVDVQGLRRYARRLFAYYVLLPGHATDLGLNETENVRDGVRRIRREALINRLREVEVTERIDVSEEEAREYYEQHKEIYVRPDRISILEILVQDMDEAEELLAKLDAGAKMEDLARQYTVRSSRIRRAGGRIQLMRPDKYGRVGFEASEAEVGQIVGPIRTNQGYSIFEVLKKIPGYQETFEEVAHRARWHLAQDLSVQRFEEFLESLRQRRGAYRIVEPALASLVTELAT